MVYFIFVPIKNLQVNENHECNVVVTWPRHMISFVITSSKILLSSSITFTYHFIPNGTPFWYMKLHLSMIENRFTYIALLNSAPATILFDEKRTICYNTLLRFISSPLFPLILLYNYWASSSKMVISWFRAFFGLYSQFKTRKALWSIVQLAECSK